MARGAWSMELTRGRQSCPLAIPELPGLLVSFGGTLKISLDLFALLFYFMAAILRTTGLRYIDNMLADVLLIFALFLIDQKFTGRTVPLICEFYLFR